MRKPLFGLSAAGYRLEGGFNGPGEPANQWTSWERAGRVPVAASGSAGLWADPARVLDGVAAAGGEVLALGIEWARIEPAPGHVDEAALDRYASILASAADLGITPVAVLHDVAHPAWLGEEFWLTPGSPDRFAEHAARVAACLAPSCRRWVTTRQPNLVALKGWVDGHHPPRRLGAVADAWAVVDNLLTAHVLAYEAVHDVQPDADVLFGLRASSSYDWSVLTLDLLCAPGLAVERDGFDRWVDARRAVYDRGVQPTDLRDLVWRRAAAATAPFGEGGPGSLGWLRRPSPRRALDVAYRFAATRAVAPGGTGGAGGAGRAPAPRPNGSTPSVGHGYPLDGVLLVWCGPPAEVAAGRVVRGTRPWEVRPDPAALATWCGDRARATPGLALWVEDGLATRRGRPRTDGWDRPAHLRAGLSAVGGLPVEGYLYHSLDGGGDPTWPDADFGLRRARTGRAGATDDGGTGDDELVACRRVVEEWRAAQGHRPGGDREGALGGEPR